MASAGIELVFDVGANVGQYARSLRRMGYRGKIISFEPVRSVFEKLERKSKNDPHWCVRNMALGDQDGYAEINISRHSESSSMLPMLSSHTDVAPESAYMGKERITIRRLDSVIDELNDNLDNSCLKVDTQGFEGQVLDGAKNALSKVRLVQLEMSLVPLYAGESLFLDLTDRLLREGYKLVALEPGLSSPATGKLLQVDGIFRRGL